MDLAPWTVSLKGMPVFGLNISRLGVRGRQPHLIVLWGGCCREGKPCVSEPNNSRPFSLIAGSFLYDWKLKALCKWRLSQTHSKLLFTPESLTRWSCSPGDRPRSLGSVRCGEELSCRAHICSAASQHRPPQSSEFNQGNADMIT